MRIGVDGACWSNPRGYGRYTRELLGALMEVDDANSYAFFLDPETGAFEDIPERVRKITIGVSENPNRAASSNSNRSLSDMWKMGRAVAAEPLDLFFYPSVYTYFPVFSRVKKIVTIHDVIPEKYPELVFNSARSRLFWKMKVWAAVRQADLILTVSDSSRRGIMEVFGTGEERIRVVGEAADEVFRPLEGRARLDETRSRFGIKPEERFILYVGGISPHKNLKTLVRTFGALVVATGHGNVKLVLAGDYEGDSFLMDIGLRDEIGGLKLGRDVIFTGYVTDDDLVALYNAATVFVLPSFIEGFGLPALEAMACGTPVIGSSTTSLPEVLGDAGLLFDPESAGELLERLRAILENDHLRKDLSARSLARAATFCWRKSAEAVLEVFNEFNTDGPPA
ncbi:MAG: glycosyltransferase family 4 protein [Thermodesulfobacteriota bacterium]